MLELADVVRRFGASYRQRYGARMPPSHRAALYDLESCRTPARGGQVWRCDQDACQAVRYAYHSCRNRSCPKCHREQTAQWLARRCARLPACRYFLVTVTLPSELRALARSHQRAVLGALMQTAAAALLTLTSDPVWLGATPAVLAVLHTWTQDLRYHPHVHLLVSAGGLDRAGRWVEPRHPEYLLPSAALARIFRGKMAAALRRVRLLSGVPVSVWSKPWVLHCQHAGDGEKVLEYLARYVFRVAITNARIEAIEETGITFRARDRRSGEVKHCTLPPLVFLARFLQHVLPKGFVKVRSYGLLAPRNRRRRELLRTLLELPVTTSRPPAPAADAKLSPLPAPPPRPPLRCPLCQVGIMQRVQQLPPRRGPP